MVAAVHSQTHTPRSPKPLNIRLRNRVYPLSIRPIANRGRTGPGTSSLEVGKPDLNQRSQRFRKSVLNSMSFPDRPLSGFSDTAAVVRAFGRDMMLLETMSVQWGEFLANLTASRLRVTSEKGVPAKKRKQAIADIMHRLGYKPRRMVDDANTLTSGLLRNSTESVYRQLQAALKSAVDRFLHLLREDLERLADVRIVGLIEWATEDACKFHFFEHQLKVTLDSKTRQESRQLKQLNDEWVVEKKAVKTLAGQSIHQVCRIEEHLMGATSTSPGEASLPVPGRIEQVIDSVPKWLSSEVAIVEGEKFREERVLLTRHANDWSVTEVERTIEPHFDPAVTLFDEFVLAGWDHREHEREIRRRIEVANERLENTRAERAAAKSARMKNLVQMGMTGLLLFVVIRVAFSHSAIAGVFSLVLGYFVFLAISETVNSGQRGRDGIVKFVMSMGWLLTTAAFALLIVAWASDQAGIMSMGVGLACLAIATQPLAYFIETGFSQEETPQ